MTRSCFTRIRTDAKAICALAVFSAMSLGCRDDALAPTPSPVRPSFLLSTGATVQLKDVPELTMDLPPTARPWDESDTAFVAAMHQAKSKAFIGFKNPGRVNVARTARMEVQEAWRPNVMVKKGVRAGVDGNSLRAGLALIEGRGASVLSYY